jgi:Tfp pilus assembly protein PilF
LVRELPADDRDILITDVSRSSSVERVVELVKVLQAQGLTRDADALLGAAARRTNDLAELFLALGQQDRTADIEFLLDGPQTWNQTWSRQLRTSIAAALEKASVNRETWRPLLRRHAAYMPKNQFWELTLLFGVLIFLGIAFSIGYDHTGGPAKVVVGLSGCVTLIAFGFYVTHRTIWTNRFYASSFFVFSVGPAMDWLPIGDAAETVAVLALVLTGTLWIFRRQHEIGYLRAWYRKAIAQHRLNAPLAMYRLAGLENEEGKINDAQDWYTKATAMGNVYTAPWAMNDLGWLKQQTGEQDAARDWYTKAAATENTAAAAQAMLNLGILETQQNNHDAARDWYTKAIATERPYTVTAELIALLPEDGRITATVRRLYAKATARKAHAAPWAMYELGRLEDRLQNHSAARDWFTKAAATRNAEAASKAADALALLKL